MAARGLVDLLIPRGGEGLIRACVEQAKVPCIETGTGICHIYVDRAADLAMALSIVDNAKTTRPSVCNAAEVCLVHEAVAGQFLPMLAQRMAEKSTPSCAFARARRPSSRARPPGRTILTPSFWIIFWPCAWWAAWKRRWPTLRPIPRAILRPSSQATRRRRRPSAPRWTAPPCM